MMALQSMASSNDIQQQHPPPQQMMMGMAPDVQQGPPQQQQGQPMMMQNPGGMQMAGQPGGMPPQMMNQQRMMNARMPMAGAGPRVRMNRAQQAAMMNAGQPGPMADNGMNVQGMQGVPPNMPTPYPQQMVGAQGQVQFQPQMQGGPQMGNFPPQGPMMQGGQPGMPMTGPMVGGQVPVGQPPVGPGMVPSPYSQQAGHGPGMVPSPMGQLIRNQGPPSNASMSSMGPSPMPLNTPQNIPQTSPMTQQSQAELMCMEKLRSLQKYVEPLRRMIAKGEREDLSGERKREIDKLKSLYRIISDPTARTANVDIQMLNKCEQWLERMDVGKARDPITVSVGGPSTSATLASGQLLIDTIINNIKKPNFNHTLSRTIGPAMAALSHSSYAPHTSPTTTSNRSSDDESYNGNDTSSVTNSAELIQGEIARLDHRFKVLIDPLQIDGSSNVHVICRLDDLNLPSVPPIEIEIPADYPQQPPFCALDDQEYTGSDFLTNIKNIFIANVVKLPEQHSITALLQVWEQSIRQAAFDNIHNHQNNVRRINEKLVQLA